MNADNPVELVCQKIKSMGDASVSAYCSYRDHSRALAAANWIQENDPKIVSLVRSQGAIIAVVKMADESAVVFGGLVAVDHFCRLYGDLLSANKPDHSHVALPSLPASVAAALPASVAAELHEPKRPVRPAAPGDALVAIIVYGGLGVGSLGVFVSLLFVVWGTTLGHLGTVTKLLLSWVAFLLGLLGALALAVPLALLERLVGAVCGRVRNKQGRVRHNDPESTVKEDPGAGADVSEQRVSGQA